MSERERPYDRYRRNRKYDLRTVLLTRTEMKQAREAVSYVVARTPNPPRNPKQMALYSLLEELKDAPYARIAEREKAELVEALKAALSLTGETAGKDTAGAVVAQAETLLAKHEQQS